MRSSYAMNDFHHAFEAGRGVIPLRTVPREERERTRRHLLRLGFRLIRPGWYAGPGADAAAVAAVAAGGTLSCIQALSSDGVWHPPNVQGLHVRFLRAQPLPPHVIDHRIPGPRQPLVSAVDLPVTALACAIKCLPMADAVAVCDSVLRLHVLEPHEVMDALRLAGKPGARVKPAIDPSADSGIESHLRVMLRSLGIRHRTQVMIRDVGRTDTLIGDRLVVEADGLEYHSGEHASADRRRDMRLHQLGFLVFRFSYWQILSQQDEVKATIRAALRAREHRWSARNCLWRRMGLPDPVLGEYRSEPVQRWFAIQ